MTTEKITPAEQAKQIDQLVREVPYNSNKAKEHGDKNAKTPPQGMTATPPSPSVSASTLSESNASEKTGVAAEQGHNGTNGPLENARADAGGQRLTTNQGMPVSDNQNSLKAGLRGPALLEDFVLREKLTHFDHERIPERIVHARGSAAHGYFEAYEALTEFTRAAPFSEKGKVTPVFTRFSTVAGERGSVDTARDIRGFAVKFYTDEGNWDLVGNSIPVFFIQDAMKFPDLVHAVKPEPHNGIPQAGSAHDTFWDFVSLMPESTHTLMWTMSDRGIPRSYRMMQGFGVHTFRLVNANGESHFVKFHWKPLLGTHSLVWDEAAKIQGADNDFHRRDLWDAIESGEYPEWELGLQIFTEAQADSFSFDVLDATKIVPEELIPVTPVGKMVLNRNPDNFFAETEQVAFCTANIVLGIDFTNDPLLAGRIHSYLDTQITRLGGMNFHEIPINSPIAPVQNNQRDGLHRQAINRGKVAYEPNSLAGGCPFQTGEMGFVTFPEEVSGDKVRGKPEKFADHYTQATLFWESQTEWEQDHIVGGFRFELSKVTVPAIRERMLSSLVNVSDELAAKVANGLGIAVPKAMPKAMTEAVSPEVGKSAALSLTALPGEKGIRSRKVAILVADGVVGQSILSMQKLLEKAGAKVFLVGPKLGAIKTTDEKSLEAVATLENSPGVLFDAVILPDGEAGVAMLAQQSPVMEFIANQYLHGKTMMAIGAGKQLFEHVESLIHVSTIKASEGLLLTSTEAIETAGKLFIEALTLHRHPVR